MTRMLRNTDEAVVGQCIEAWQPQVDTGALGTASSSCPAGTAAGYWLEIVYRS